MSTTTAENTGIKHLDETEAELELDFYHQPAEPDTNTGEGFCITSVVGPDGVDYIDSVCCGWLADQEQRLLEEERGWKEERAGLY